MTDERAWQPPNGTSAKPAPPRYAGPPPTTPPTGDWRPPMVVVPPPPRTLPAQDDQEIEELERDARTVTYGVGLLAGAVLLVILLVLCGRALF